MEQHFTWKKLVSHQRYQNPLQSIQNNYTESCLNYCPNIDTRSFKCLQTSYFTFNYICVGSPNFYCKSLSAKKQISKHVGIILLNSMTILSTSRDLWKLS